ncbi:hypothetical protein BDV18DRAFT_162899 [Aspergillus unguis]
MAASPGAKPETETEKAEVEPQAAPPDAIRRPETDIQAFSHAEGLTPSSLPLLRKLHLPPRWKTKWHRRKRPENVQQQDETQERVILQQETRSSTSGSIAPYMDNGDDGDEDNLLRDTTWEKVRRFLPDLTGCGCLLSRIAYHHVLMSISAVAIIMLSLLLASCSSHRMRSVYLLELSYNDNLEHKEPAAANPLFYSLVGNISSTGDLAVRIGYFGICIATTSGSDTGSWTCRANATDLVLLVQPSQDPLNLLAIADNFRDKVIVSAMM